MRISDLSSDVCSSDLVVASIGPAQCGCIRTLRRCTVWWTFAFLAGGNMRIISCALALVLLAGCASTIQKRRVLLGNTVPGGTLLVAPNPSGDLSARVGDTLIRGESSERTDRKSTRLNSSH